MEPSLRAVCGPRVNLSAVCRRGVAAVDIAAFRITTIDNYTHAQGDPRILVPPKLYHHPISIIQIGKKPAMMWG